MNDGFNKVILLGNLGADPELRYTQAGTAVLSLRLATNESYVDRNKDAQERTEWHSVVVWGTRAEALSKHLTKGNGVLIEGALRTSSYEKDGVKRYKTEIHAKEVCLLGGKRPVGAATSPEEEAVARAGAMTKSAGAVSKSAPARTAARAEVVEELPY